MNTVVTPDVPVSTEMCGELIQELINSVEITNCYLNYIFCALIWVIILTVLLILFKLLYRILFGRNDLID